MAEVQTDFRTAEFVLADHAGTNNLRHGNERGGRRREEKERLIEALARTSRQRKHGDRFTKKVDVGVSPRPGESSPPALFRRGAARTTTASGERRL